MSATQAKMIEMSIILLCVLSLVAIFQPFSKMLFSIGCVTVIIGGLAFNLVPHCRAGVTGKELMKVVYIVLIVLGIAGALGILTANLYIYYLGTLR